MDVPRPGNLDNFSVSDHAANGAMDFVTSARREAISAMR
jgi:hypothetical protein